MPYVLNKRGAEVEAALDKIIALGPATNLTAGTMSAEDKEKLDAIGIHYNTTHYWNCLTGYIPAAGEIIIYSDYDVVTVDGVTKYVPGIKIGSGNGYVQDLAFVGDNIIADLTEHIEDNIRHLTAEERAFWNNKLNVDDSAEVLNETLIFNRN